MVQTTWFTFPLGSVGSPPDYNHPGYNPEQAGGNNYRFSDGSGSAILGTPTFAVSCTDSATLLIIGGTTDYFSAEVNADSPTRNAGYKVGNPVMAGAINLEQFTTPYTITQIATFVPNPGGVPAYYLKLTQTIFNNHPTENFVNGDAGLAVYVPPSFVNIVSDPPTCQFSVRSVQGTMCSVANTPKIVGGLYTTTDHSFGTAAFMRPAQWQGATATWINYDGEPSPGSESNAFGVAAQYCLLQPTLSSSFEFYVMVGPWSAAMSFAASR
jgi:hypothetical protein